MKHVFVINPNAGKVDRTEAIKKALEKYNGEIDYEVFVTSKRGDEITIVRNYMDKLEDKNEVVRFYACGGDGTLNNTVNGVYGYKNAEVACFPAGSGNDFVKVFGAGPEFKELDCLIKGESKEIDLLKVNDSYCINILNMGFDGEVTYDMCRFKRWPLVSGPMAYNLGVLNCLLFKMSYQMKVTVDDEVVHDGKMLLVAVANGFCYGGGFHCAPLAKVDDGVIDMCFVKKISRFKASGLIACYKAGKHLDNEKLKKYLIYKKCKHVVLECKKPVAYANDGETFKGTKLDITIIPKAIRFVVPKKLGEVKAE